ncbi:Shikimate kinase I [Candidatus Chlamydia sanziniae]|uniref:Shikimate kinase I n=1 Tax=Candidatus Chlamydia sanziniae TaxID=1806891 RepID=A0A1A9HV04_9CHLA|nr:Shikimate kinase I [Candidatus Chlamydia sanziniae]
MLGKALANYLSAFFYDLDDLIVSNYGCELYSTCDELYTVYGEERFREWETEQLSFLSILSCSEESYVFALGGGTLMNKKAYQVIKNKGCIVFLSLALSSVYARLHKRGLPKSLKKSAIQGTLEETLIQRIQRMTEIAHYTFPVDTINLSDKNSVQRACHTLHVLLLSK